MSSLRLRIFVVSALLAATLFVRLGFWQLQRRDERRTRNALVMARLDSAEVEIDRLPRDTSRAHYRRVRVRGVPDYDRELVLASRTHLGSPGINLITPVRIPGNDTAVLVNRGWVYSPDGATVDLSRRHDRDSVFSGYVEQIPTTGGAAFQSRPRVLGRLTASVLAGKLPYPIAPFYVVILGDSAPSPDRPARLGIPPLDDGPHLSYAIQWFGFALVALAGAGVVLAKRRGGQT